MGRRSGFQSMFCALGLGILITPLPNSEQPSAQNQPTYTLVAPQLVVQGETFTGQVLETSADGDKPLSAGERVSIQGQVVEVEGNGKVRVPAVATQLGDFLLSATILREGGASASSQVTQHIEVVSPAPNPESVPVRIAQIPEVLWDNTPIRLEGQRLQDLNRAVLARGDGTQIELNDSVGSSLQRIYLPPPGTTISPGDYRLTALDAKGNQYEAPGQCHRPTLQLQGPTLRTRGQHGEITITADVNGQAVLMGGEPIITLHQHTVELRANQPAKIGFVAKEVGNYHVSVSVQAPQQPISPAPAERVQARTEPVQARYDPARNVTTVSAAMHVVDTQGKPVAHRPVDVALCHPGGVEYGKLDTDSQGRANFSKSLAGQISVSALSVFVYAVLGQELSGPPAGKDERPSANTIKPGYGISFAVALKNTTNQPQTATVQDPVPPGASHLDPASVHVTGSTTAPQDQSDEATGVYVTGITVPPLGTATVEYTFHVAEGVKNNVSLSNTAWVNGVPTNPALTPPVSNATTTSQVLESTKTYTGSHVGTTTRPPQVPEHYPTGSRPTPTPIPVATPTPTPRIPVEPPPTDRTKKPCDCQCHTILKFDTGEPIKVQLVSPASPGTLEVPLGSKVPLAANALDTDLLTVTCKLEGCGPVPCPPCAAVQTILLPGTVTYRWELISGAGKLVSSPQYPHPHSALAEGPAAIYKAPEGMPDDTKVTIRLTVDDSPEYLADIDDPPVVKTIQFKLVEPQPGKAFNVPAQPGSPRPPAPPPTATSPCPCQPTFTWEAFKPIEEDKDDTTTFAVGVNDYVVLQGHAKDVDRLTLQCAGSLCSSPPMTFTLNDALKYTWSAGKGKIIGTSEKVVYQAPANPGKDTVTRTVEDSGIHPGPAHEGKKRPPVDLTIEIIEVKIVLAGDYIVPGSGDNLIRYQLNPASVDAVRLEVYDQDSKLVRTINDLPTANGPSGWAEFKWNGLDEAGRHLKRQGSPYRLRVVATKRRAETQDEAEAEVKSWKFTYRISDRPAGPGAEASGIDLKTVIPSLVETTVQAHGSNAVRAPVYSLSQVNQGVDVTLMNSTTAGDFLYVYTSPTNTDRILYTIRIHSYEGGALDKAGNEWDMDPAAPGIQRTTIWELYIDEDGKIKGLQPGDKIKEIIQ